MKARTRIVLFLATLSLSALAEGPEAQLSVAGGPDRACSQNCLYASVNGEAFRLIGCNKPSNEIGRCRSTGVPAASFAFVPVDGTQQVVLRVVTRGPGERRGHVTFDSRKQGLVPGRDFRILSRTPSTLDVWLNDNDDRDPYDLRVRLRMPDETPFQWLW